MPSYKLYYFDTRGRAELIRWIFAAGNIEYEDIRLDQEQWAKKKPEAPFGQMPLLEVDGVVLTQSNSIARFLAKRTGLAGKTDIEEARVDMVADCIEDVVKVLIPIFFTKDPAAQAALLDKWKTEQAPQYLTYLERFVSENRTGYLVGDGLTWADFSLVLTLTGAELASPIDYTSYPGLSGLKDKVHAHQGIADWIKRRPETS